MSSRTPTGTAPHLRATIWIRRVNPSVCRRHGNMRSEGIGRAQKKTIRSTHHGPCTKVVPVAESVCGHRPPAYAIGRRVKIEAAVKVHQIVNAEPLRAARRVMRSRIQVEIGQHHTPVESADIERALV